MVDHKPDGFMVGIFSSPSIGAEDAVSNETPRFRYFEIRV